MLTIQQLRDAKMGEFQELAWRLKFELIIGLTALQKAQLLKSFADFADDNQLGIAGSNEQFIVVSLLNRKAPTTTEQQLLEKWLNGNPQVYQVVETSPLEQFSDAHFESLLVDENAIENESFIRFFS